MNDYWNNLPDEPEMPDWYQELDLAIEDETMPQVVKDGIQKLLNEWVQAYNEFENGCGDTSYDLFDENDFYS
jgi:hypothetical protein